MQYIILGGALKNVGDFLIAKRTRELLEFHKPGAQFLELNRYEDLSGKLELVNQSNAVILAGGPGYLPNMYPKTFRLTPNLDDIKAPLIALGMGWYGTVGDDLDVNTYRFSSGARKLLQRLSRDFAYLGTRDYLTEKVLQRHGVQNTLMTGCPAWYDVNYVQKPYELDSTVKSVAFSTPAAYRYQEQSLLVMDLIKKHYPDAKLYCTFHRGIDSDRYTKKSRSNFFNHMADYAKRLGFECIDLAYDAANMGIYDRCDLHIGYRVHAHIYCLSHFRKTILLEEDGRGRGANEALGTVSLRCNKRIITPNESLLTGVFHKLANKLITADNSVVAALDQYIGQLKAKQYTQMKPAFDTIKEKYKSMEQFIAKIP